MNFNRFEAAGNPRNRGNFSQFPPDASEPRGWGPPNNFGNNRRGLGNQNLNNSPTYSGQGGGFTNNWNNQPAFQRGMGSSAIRCHHSHLDTYPPQTGYSYGPAQFPGPMSAYPIHQEMASNFCCQYPPSNAPEYLPYPGLPIVMIRTPCGQWIQPMGSMVDVYGPSTTATMDLGLELPPPDNLTQQGQPGIDHGQSLPANQVQSTEHQQDELQNPENISQSSPENLSQSAILAAPNDSEQQTDAVDQTREDGDIDATIQPTEDPALTPKAGPSSDMRKAGCQTTQPSLAGSDKQLQETDIAELDGADDQQVTKTISRRKRRRITKKKTKCCRLCLNNGEAPEVYETHDVVDGLGVTTCPYLREQVCVLCKKTGDKAHTLKYCPTNIENRRWFWRQRKRAIENA